MTKDDWISVEEQLPESDTFNYVKMKSGANRVSYYYQDSFGKWWSTENSIWDKNYTQIVTHWKPHDKIVVMSDFIMCPYCNETFEIDMGE